MPLSLSAFFAMEIIAEYSLPILAALMLIIFYLGLPDLQRCTLDRPGGRRLDRVDAAIMAALNIADGYFKAQETAENLRKQVKQYLDEATRIKMELSESKRELFRLQ